MMKKDLHDISYRIYESHWNPETGVSIVTIQRGLNYYTGAAKCHKDDMEQQSSFLGVKIAEGRAVQAMFRHLYFEVVDEQEREEIILILGEIDKKIEERLNMREEFFKKINKLRKASGKNV